jgi:hypothetical protein
LFSDSKCSSPVAGVSGPGPIVTAGDVSRASYSTGWTPPAPGTYYWLATYAGDPNNNGFTTKCGDPNEEVVIPKIGITISTQASPTTGTLGVNIPTLKDVATINGTVAALMPTGTISFKLYSNSSCTAAVAGVGGSGPVSTNSGVSTASYSTSWTPPAGGTYYWIASYLGDGNYKGFTTGCNDPNEEITIASTATSQLTPTQTTCTQFAQGQAPFVGPLGYGVKSNAINSVSPGVFFDYTSFQAPVTGSFSVSVAESNNGPKQANGQAWPNFTSLNGQVVLYNANCAVLPAKVTTTSSGGVLTYTVAVTGATVGQTFIIGIKYSPGTITGTKVRTPLPTVLYTYQTILSTGSITLTTSSLTLVPRP